MHIAVVTETFLPEINGVSKTLSHLCQGLVKKGVTLDLISPGRIQQPGPGITSWQAPGHPLPGYPGLKFGWKLPSRVKKQWLHRAPQVFYIATQGPLGLDALRFARKHRIPAVTGYHTSFDLYLQHYRLGWLQKPLHQYLRFFHRASTLTLTPSIQQQELLQDAGFGQVERLGRGVDTRIFGPQKRSEKLRRQLGLAPGDLLVGYVGRLAAEKNLELLLKSFQAIHQEHPSARLLVVGDGPWKEEIQRRCPAAILVGSQEGENLAGYYASMDLFLFPSLTDTYGNVVAEALASGLPLVAYRRAAAAELIAQGKNGWLVETNTSEQGFIQAARELAGEDRLRLIMGHLASQSIQKLSWNEVCERFYQYLMASQFGGERHEQQTQAADIESLGRKI
ncbi:glycosyltransferase family 4 protein [Marinospirillum perlucidum]|uniref:glycosyltransferase family 4 protein n=1 Tax=Marinospirillum perlucidum TaxID=1982602 RepID=UPI000DF136BD|nr:glycosyltransferase family 1 protein [Marinospirillum perlucidum]